MWPFNKKIITEERLPNQPCNHVWTKWKPYMSGAFFQRRECIECGFIQEKEI